MAETKGKVEQLRGFNFTIDEGVKYSVTWEKNDHSKDPLYFDNFPTKIKVITICKIVVETSSEDPLVAFKDIKSSAGGAFCCLLDNYNEDKGIKLSFERAVTPFDKETRTRLWRELGFYNSFLRLSTNEDS